MKLTRTRSFRAGGYSAVAVVIVAAIAIAVNLMASALPTSQTQLDITENALYTLSDQSRRILSTVQDPVRVYLISDGENDDANVTNLLAQYEGMSDKVTIETVDSVARPDFASKYTEETVANNDVLVVCGDKSEHLKYQGDIWQAVESENFAYYYRLAQSGHTEYLNYLYDYVFAGENALSGAISRVSSRFVPRLYLMQGHDEAALCASLLQQLEVESFSVAEFNFLETQALPSDADIILINVPKSDLSPDEADALIDFLDRGGDVLIVFNAVGEQPPVQLTRVTMHMGVSPKPGMVVEGSATNYYQSPSILLPVIKYSPATLPVYGGKYYIMFPFATGLTHEEEVGTYTALLVSSRASYLKAPSATVQEKETGDAAGPFDLAALIENGGTKMALFTSPVFLEETMNTMVSGSNFDLFLSTLNCMAEREADPNIAPKSVKVERLTVSEQDRITWSVVLIGVVPCVLLLAGLTIILWRKHR